MLARNRPARGLGPGRRVCYDRGMMQGFVSGLVRAALALLVAVVLSAAGWAHRPPTPVDNGSAGLAVYLAAGGSLADLCGTPDGTAIADKDCPVCRMPSALSLPARIAPPAVLAVTVIAVDTKGDSPHGSGRHPPWYGRAPPVV